jgi:hypothetical protein
MLWIPQAQVATAVYGYCKNITGLSSDLTAEQLAATYKMLHVCEVKNIKTIERVQEVYFREHVKVCTNFILITKLH